MHQAWSRNHHYAAVKDAQIKFRKKEYASSMEQHGQRRDAAVKDAQIKSSEEEFALSMEQNTRDAAVKDAQIKFGKEECARGTEQTAILTTDPLLLDQNTRRLLQLSLYPFSALLVLHTKEVMVFLERLSSVKKS